ncbi:flagellar hook protein FlgE [Georgenia yuyongxinii]|uniref:Flagellar hook protein FlgE n=1 Tax=Georgenia yuyongxinii TaxID=2589797 RepID=A0A552WS29_9MICO|nr:flagellar hook protein FlgE [Georgenia yuyongxinii]TRW45630.1 flagellar hook protein FlgE [Georgenia yuyongxinii]
MLRSLFSGISSLRSHQTMLDVTGNNIANVNTTGYKAARTQFEDTLSQVIQNAGAPQAGQGGTNPAQVGLGVQVSAITNDFSDGATQQTGRALDMKITGDGFFIINDGTEQLFTRAGAFTLDALGQLTTAGGALVQGWSAPNGQINATGPLGAITLPVSTTMGARLTGQVTLAGNLPADAEVYDSAVNPPTGVQLTRSIDVYDTVGTGHSLDLVFSRTNAGWDVKVYSGVDSTGAPVQVGAGGLFFNDGILDSASSAITVTMANGQAITFDIGSLTGYADLTTVEAAGQDGQGAGTLQSFSMNADGTLIGSFSNGFKQPVGQIALANFANAAGLEKAGGTAFRSTVNSGEAQVGVGGTGGRGSLTSRALEMSNVDLSQEFTNLIIAQRGFQAGSRVITTSDELLQELVNLKR